MIKDNKSDYGFKVVNPNNDVQTLTAKIHFIDLAGATEYSPVRQAFHTHTSAILLVYDVNDRASFDALPEWVDEHRRYCEVDDVCLARSDGMWQQSR